MSIRLIIIISVIILILFLIGFLTGFFTLIYHFFKKEKKTESTNYSIDQGKEIK